MRDIQVLGVIPARALSSRFPRKMVAPILGKPMLQYVWEAAQAASVFDQVCIATDDEGIATTVRAFGAMAIVTPEFPSGSDRVAFISEKFPSAQIIVNIQGDEPLISPTALGALVEALKRNLDADMATLAILRDDEAELLSFNVVKVVCSAQGRALYFSRHPLRSFPKGVFLKHIGIYAFRRTALQRFCALPPSPLELSEKLEQLRALEAGMSIYLHLSPFDTIAVDTPEDIAKVERRLEEDKIVPVGPPDTVQKLKMRPERVK